MILIVFTYNSSNNISANDGNNSININIVDYKTGKEYSNSSRRGYPGEGVEAREMFPIRKLPLQIPFTHEGDDISIKVFDFYC